MATIESWSVAATAITVYWLAGLHPLKSIHTLPSPNGYFQGTVAIAPAPEAQRWAIQAIRGRGYQSHK